MNQTAVVRFLLGVLLLASSPSNADLFSSSPNPFSTPDILPVDEAFRLGAVQDSEGTRIFWQVTPGYYLYRDRFGFAASERPLTVTMPEGELRQDEIFGEVQVLDGLVEVLLPYALEEIEVSYQGCAAQGYCYPPQKLSLTALKSD